MLAEKLKSYIFFNPENITPLNEDDRLSWFILQNLRPISVLNVNYKTATKAIANRLEKALPSFLNLDQTG